MYRLLLISVFLLLNFGAAAQIKCLEPDGIPPALEHEILLQQATYAQSAKNKTTKTTAGGPVFDTARWNFLVDSTWGTGIADSEKLKVFDRIWKTFDSMYPCFIHLPMYNWDSIVNGMRTEINNGVSRGRFAAILNELRRYINDGHSSIYDVVVNYPSIIYLGLPLMRAESGRFGACVTMLSDSSAMVYESEPNHVFSLQPGDIILGYNDMPWKELIKIILKYRLPSSINVGSTDAATYHKMIQAAGENWHLFDTINIKKCNGSLVNYPTSLMYSTGYSRFCTEQLPVKNIKKNDYNDYYYLYDAFSSGMIAGTKIGYVYMYDCLDAGDSLYNNVKMLIEDSLAEALILDIRTNFGGGYSAYWKTFDYLRNGFVQWVGYGERVSPFNRYQLFNQPSSWYNLNDAIPMAIYKPIALLQGPRAISAGDLFQLMYKHYPWLKTFGKSTAGAFGSRQNIALTNADYKASLQPINFYEVTNPSHYLTHTEYPIDFPVWLDRDSVCAGKDNVVSEAVKWIMGQLAIKDAGKQKQTVKIYPNPASNYTNVVVNNATNSMVKIRLRNLLGQVLLEQTGHLDNGSNKCTLNLANIPAGNYYLSILSKHSMITEKLVIIK
jgi:hypothetical protein